MTFKEYKGLDLTQTGKDVLERWKRINAFGKSLELREGAPEFIFFEGPPSANGMPGIHHVMARSIKDAICRYKTQTGFKVARRAGWDTHGLPVELGVEKKLGITKADIGTKVSVDEYNATCRKEVMKYTAEWENMTERVGYWVDMKDPYITYDNRYIETLWYLLKQIYGKGLLYKGYTIQPYSPTDGTGLSSHELNQPGCYKDVSDTTATVQFEIIKDGASQPLYGTETVPAYFLAWTTTPWTLPSNTALCVGPEIEYIRVLSFNPYTGAPAVYVLAKDLLGAWFNPKGAEIPLEAYEKGDKIVPYKVLEGCFKGKDLVGIRYHQLIPWFKPDGDAFRVIPGDYVTTSDGTGIVHIAPTFGADDKRVAAAAGIGAIMPIDKDGNPQAQVDRQGRFMRLEDMDPAFAATVDPSYKEYSGRYVKAGYKQYFEHVDEESTLDIDLSVMMKADGRAFKVQKHVHSYPHSWRTDLPVLYYPLDSWFIKASAVKDEMVALNKEITWKPASTGTGRFGQWLENIQDWNLSRSRYWGTPLPIWRTEDGKEEICIGSVKELYNEIDKAVAAGIMASNPLRDKGFDPEDMSLENYNKIDLHRPYVDYIFLVSASGKKMTRETDLIDVWFDSGAMPYAQEGLRNLGKPCFGATADFIAEGVDQTRGWFYTLHAIHTMISGTPAFKRVISNGLVLDKNGNKMSKRLGNAVDPFQALDNYGADALRWYMLTNAEPWDNLKFDESGVSDVRRKFFGTLYNTYAFFARYANIDGWCPNAESEDKAPAGARPGRDFAQQSWKGEKAAGVYEGAEPPVLTELDRWILSKLNTVIRDVRAAYEDYDVKTAGRILEAFVCDDVSNWYVRLNRQRYWAGEMTPDKEAAYATLYKVLVDVAVLAAPIAPFFMDQLYLDLTDPSSPSAPQDDSCHSERSEESVHFTLMPEPCEEAIDKDLEERMALAQQATSLILGIRKKVNIPVRQPLLKVMIPVISDKVRRQLAQVKGIILTEVNVKEMEFIEDASGIMTLRIKPNFKVLGKTYGARMKEIAAGFAALEQGTISAIQKAETAGEAYTLALPGGDVVLNPGDYAISSEDVEGWQVASEGSLTVALDIEVTPELRLEGLSRELVNRIQNLRKASGFEVTDRIHTVVYSDDPALAQALQVYSDYIKSQTLSLSIGLENAASAPAEAAEVEWTEGTIKLTVKR
ncbi:MAG: isoleucine--tRNA ligase [Bacteroidales bacterium]|nr:isoleucine--tRNA ligase [Bacteroidales bacterium]